MSKKSNLFRLIMSLALAATLLLGMILPAMASRHPDPSDLTGSPHTGGTPANPLQAMITKMIRMPENTTIPTYTFQFLVEKKALEFGDVADMPTLGNPSTGIIDVAFPSGATDTLTPPAGFKMSYKMSIDLFNGITWPQTGIYYYKVTEISPAPSALHADGSLTTLLSDKDEEKIWFSKAEYELRVEVRQDNTPGSPTFGQRYVWGLSAVVIDDDNGDPKGNVKTDPTPGGKTEYGSTFSGLVFTNDYIKYTGNGPDIPDPQVDPFDSAFEISKAVAGDGADQGKNFSFTFKLNRSSSVKDTADYYRAYVIDNTGAVVNPSAIGFTAIDGHTIVAAAGVHPYIKVKVGTDITVLLKHGYRISVVDMAVGATYAVEEAGAEGYTPAYTLTADGDIQGELKADSMNIRWPVVNPLSLGEGKNSADYKNYYEASPLTGVTMNDLPYVVLLALVVGAGVAFMVIKYRKAAQQSAE